MARVTVDDCMSTIQNRFQMTLAASYRARQISAGASPMVEADRDKPTVIALRELAQALLGQVEIRHQRRHRVCDQAQERIAGFLLPWRIGCIDCRVWHVPPAAWTLVISDTPDACVREPAWVAPRRIIAP